MSKNELAIPAQASGVPAPYPLAPLTMGDIMLLGEKVARSKLFMMDEAQAIVLMMVAAAQGDHPINAVQQYHVVQGRPSMKSTAMLARWQKAGGTVQWVSRTDTLAEAIFTHPLHAPRGERFSFSMQDAARAGLTNNPMYKKWPANMLRSRVISLAIDFLLPGLRLGIYTEEEAHEIAFEEQQGQLAPPPVEAPEPPVATRPGPARFGPEAVAQRLRPAARPAPPPAPTPAPAPIPAPEVIIDAEVVDQVVAVGAEALEDPRPAEVPEGFPVLLEEGQGAFQGDQMPSKFEVYASEVLVYWNGAWSETLDRLALQVTPAHATLMPRDRFINALVDAGIARREFDPADVLVRPKGAPADAPAVRGQQRCAKALATWYDRDPDGVDFFAGGVVRGLLAETVPQLLAEQPAPPPAADDAAAA